MHLDFGDGVKRGRAILLIVFYFGYGGVIAMKFDLDAWAIEDTASSDLMVASPEDIALSIARLKEENEALRRLAAVLTLTSRGDRLRRSGMARGERRGLLP
jgi:hypothetical protein